MTPLIVAFVALFLLADILIVLWFWRRAKRREQAEDVGELDALSEKVKKPGGAGCLALFFGVFFFAGCAAFYFGFVRPTMSVYEARTWNPVHCEMLSCEVTRHDDDDGTTYGVAVRYAYEFEGRRYESSRRSFLESSGSYKAANRYVCSHPPGLRMTCYVNPSKPAEAVLEREFSGSMFILLMVSLVFMAVGAGGISVLIVTFQAYSIGAGDRAFFGSRRTAGFFNV